MISTNDGRQYESRGAALWMRQKRLALDKARRAAEASENISVPVDVLRRKQAQLRGDAATTSADRRPLRIVTSKTATNTLLRWTSGVPARWLASLPLRVDYQSPLARTREWPFGTVGGVQHETAVVAVEAERDLRVRCLSSEPECVGAELAAPYGGALRPVRALDRREEHRFRPRRAGRAVLERAAWVVLPLS